ncbi:MAG: tetratricopeptide repeat protein, partial [Polyangiales bacterium]
ATYLAIRMAVLGGMRASGGSDHVLTALRYLAPLELEGFLGALWPRRLYLRFLNHEMAALGGFELAVLAVSLLAIPGSLWALRRRAPVFAWGIFWFGVNLAPAALIAGMLWPGFGRYLYLPSVGLAASVGALSYQLWIRFPRWRIAQTVAAVVYLAVLGTSLRGWTRDFRDIETLYSATIAKNPKGPHAYGWLGIALRKKGRAANSIGPLKIARELAPEVPRYTHHLVYALLAVNRNDAAVEVAEQCVHQHSNDAAECRLLLFATYQTSEPERAIRSLHDCVEQDRKPKRCAEAYEQALTTHPLKARYREILDQN